VKRRSSTRHLATPLLALALAGCSISSGPLVAPLRYRAEPLTPDEPWRAQPPASPPAPPAPAIPFETSTLPNGLTVVHVPRPGLPSVSIRLVIARGSADVGAPLDTFSILEHLLSAGTEKRSSGQLGRAYADLGATHSASCNADGCELVARVGVAELDAAVGLLAETALTPRLAPYDFSLVRERWMYDFAPSHNSSWLSRTRNTARLLFGHAHPYGFALFPSAHTRDLTVTDVAALHAQLFRPAHAVLVVVGDATREAVAASAMKWLGGWSSASPPLPRPPLPVSEVPTHRVVIVNHYERLQCSAWVGVAVPTVDEAELAAVAVLTRAVGGLSSALREEVRDRSGAAYSFNDATESLRGVTVAGFRGELDRDKAQDAIKSIVAALRKARTVGVPAADVALAQTNLLAEWHARASTLDGLSALTADAVERGVSPATLAAWPARLAAVTPEAVQRAAQLYFSTVSLRVVVVGDFRWLEDLDDLGLGDYQLRDGFADVVP
jgi:zinc protease